MCNYLLPCKIDGIAMKFPCVVFVQEKQYFQCLCVLHACSILCSCGHLSVSLCLCLCEQHHAANSSQLHTVITFQAKVMLGVLRQSSAISERYLAVIFPLLQLACRSNCLELRLVSYALIAELCSHTKLAPDRVSLLLSTLTKVCTMVFAIYQLYQLQGK